MKNWLNQMSLKAKLLFLVGTSLLTLVSVMLVVMMIMAEIRIGGDNYKRIVNGKDLVADILPPPMFVVESESHVQSIPSSKDQKKKLSRVKEVEKLRSAFQARVDYWKNYPYLPDDVRSQLFDKVIPSAEAYFDYVEEKIFSDVKSGNIKDLSIHLVDVQEIYDHHFEEVTKLVEITNAWSIKDQESVVSQGNQMKIVLWIMILVAVLAIVSISWFIMVSISSAAEVNIRIKQALDSVSANTMIADPNGNIVYMNNAVTVMLRNVEGDLRKALPHFNVDKVVGSNFDIFHKNPSHQRNLLSALKSTYKTEIEVSGKTFSLIANPVSNEKGERIGTVVEWSDRTAEVAIEKEIDQMVEAASAGDFTRQITLEGKEGFFKNLSAGLNKLVETTEVGINDVLRSLGAMAKGDLTSRITRDYQGSFRQLKEDVNATNERLTEIILKIREAAQSVQTGSNEISQGVGELSVRSEEQASSLEETASSMEEMTSTVKQSAENAKQANELAVAARNKAQLGGEVVMRAVTSMEEINSSSKKIADIIGVIDEIAFQTNLLALNAAVEAARAGEQGRGFAVVAGEVRNLAQRSAAAAKEIKDLIRDSVKKVEDGSQLVNESGGTLSEIVAAVEHVTRMISEIASAAQEQTSGIEQVNTAVAQMDEMTQQNAALVEEASSAGKAMADQAQQMATMMDFFTVGNSLAMGHGGGSSMTRGQGRASVSAVSSKKTSSKKPTKSSGSAKPVSNDDDWEEF